MASVARDARRPAVTRAMRPAAAARHVGAFLCMACASAAILRFPIGAFYGGLLMLTLAGCNQRPAPMLVAMLCAAALITLGPLVALKLPIQVDGNDKPQYLNFMAEMHAYGIAHIAAKQPELLSFASLHVAATLFGANDLAFLTLFQAYFGLLLLAIWRTGYRALPLFMMLFLSSSSFFGTYGNLLRQAMALPFLILMIAARGRAGAACCAALSGLAHLPALAIAAPYLLLRCAGRLATPVGIVAGVLAVLASRMGWGTPASSNAGDSYLSGKVDLYTSWDNYSTFDVTIFALALFALCCALWWRGRAWRALTDERTLDSIRRCLLALTIAAVALVATQHMTKVYERVYIYFFVTALMTLSLMIAQLRHGPFKGVVLCAAIIYGAYGFAKNIDNQSLLFRGDGYVYLTSSLLDLYDDFLLELE
ncbi:hypothetical protein WS63_07030 [Burkholderia stagnalis]|uniref:EpsG family protein n=2 Tax=Burkholderia stagnalis TaxID=1503054 RepID=UPI00075A5502|nr:hypothetical protein WS63_07030 [Burkholderia stagnalis]KVO52812.1 hypothetical protein WT18_28005 [Burkholderia stagnalis]KVP06895.1 hypothetical protein WT20_25420 [Burkholderia stagnalis]KVW97680.1 hypothetical protein WT30_09075 [Burkholderia stagnalis]KWH83347.1 hypothetical protein WT66_07495 [Burkholderia stagnalis]